MLKISLLGLFDVQLDGKILEISSRPAQLLLIFLTFRRGIHVRRDRLAPLIWPDSEEKQARDNLRHALWRLRKAFREAGGDPGDFITSTDETIQFDPPADAIIDISRLQEEAARDESIEDRITALRSYRGELLPGFYEDWILRERRRLEGVYDTRVGQLIEQLIAEGRWRQVVEWSERWIAATGAPEPAYRALMIAHSHLDDLSSVSAAYDRCVRSLGQEYDVQPSEQTHEIFARIMAGEKPIPPPAMGQPPTVKDAAGQEPPVPGEPPYKGMRYFDQEDVHLFFGREALVDRLVARLSMVMDHDGDVPQLLAVVGASGSGKSSLLRAGLVPALESEATPPDPKVPQRPATTWEAFVLTPTAHPLDVLAIELTREGDPISATMDLRVGMAASSHGLALYLAKKGRAAESPGQGGAGDDTAPQRGAPGWDEKQILLVIDQFEELFTLCRDEEERRAFIDNLVNAATRERGVWVVLGLRSDFYAHCGAYPALRTALERQQVYIGPMGRDELFRAITKPAAQGGWTFEPGLVGFLLERLRDAPGALPLLSHALLETWRRRQGSVMTFAGYFQAGGLRGAIARTADRVMEGFSRKEQEIARRIFTRLTELGEGTQDTRRPAALEELMQTQEERGAVEQVLDVLTDARLVIRHEDSVEVAHEILIREWPRLRNWLDGDREALKVHRHLSETARAWEQLDRDAAELYAGARLAQAVEWAEVHEAEMNQLEREFLEASKDRISRQAAEREAQKRRELAAARALAEAERERAEQSALRAAEQERASRRFRRLATWLGILLLISVVLAGITLHQTNLALEQARIATARELAGAALANLEVDPERSLLLAVEAAEETRVSRGIVLPEAVDALHQALQRMRVVLTLNPAGSGAFSPDGERVATAGPDDLVRIWDAAQGELLQSLSGHSDEVTNVAFSPSGEQLVSGSADGTARVWDLATGEVLLVLEGHTDSLVSPAYAPGGDRIVTTSLDGTARLWDAGSGELEFVLPHSGATAGPHFSPDGQLVAIADDGAAVARIWDTETGEEVLTLEGHEEGLSEVAFSLDGSTLATASSDFTIKLWDASTGADLTTLEGHSGWVFSVEFTPDGRHLVSGSQDGTARIWDIASGEEIMTLTGHLGGVIEVAVGPSGERVLTSGEDDLAKVWDISREGNRDWMTLAGHDDVVLEAAVSADGELAASASWDRLVKVWDLSTGVLRHSLTGHVDQVGGVAFHPAGSILASAGYDGTARIWDLTSGEQVRSLRGHNGTVTGVAFSPNGEILATGGEDGTARLWDPDTGEELQILAGHEAWVFRVAFSPDGSQLSTASWDGRAKLWDIESGEELAALAGHGDAVTGVAYSPDGTHLATSSFDAEIRIWDLTDVLASPSDIEVPPSQVLSGHAGIIWDVAFSPDGETIASASFDRTVKLWDWRAGEQTLALSSPTSVPFANVVFSPDGRLLLASTGDGTVRIYLLPHDELIALARSRLTRDLSEQECRQYLHMDACAQR